MSIDRIHVRDTVCSPPGDETGDGDRRDNSGEPRTRAAQQIQVSIDHMLRHLDKPLRVSTLSSMTGFSNSYFFVLFKSATGHAPKEFFIRLRMQRACKMLTGRAASVKEVAVALGYQDQFYFSRLFKSVTGIAPRDYRQRMRGLNPSTAPHQAGPHPQKVGGLESPFVNSVGLMSQVSA